MLSGKELSIQSLRGLAVILMVAGHVIGSEQTLGMRVTDDSFWRLSYLLLEDMRMPLFTLLSGYVYAMRPIVRVDDFPGLVRGKIVRLLIPLITVGTLFVLVQSLVPGTNSSGNFFQSWIAIFYGVSHFWFLQAIFIIFVIVGLLDAVGILKNNNYFLLVFLASCALWVLDAAPTKLFSVDGAIRLFPFFLLGYFLCTRPKSLDSKAVISVAVFIFACAYLTRILAITGALNVSVPENRIITLGVGVTALILLMKWRTIITLRWLSLIGGYSFGIYLLHVFFTASSRMVFRKLGFESDVAIFSLCLTAGVLCPVVFEVIFGKSSLISLIILGQKTQKKTQKKTTV